MDDLKPRMDQSQSDYILDNTDKIIKNMYGYCEYSTLTNNSYHCIKNGKFMLSIDPHDEYNPDIMIEIELIIKKNVYSLNVSFTHSMIAWHINDDIKDYFINKFNKLIQKSIASQCNITNQLAIIGCKLPK